MSTTNTGNKNVVNEEGHSRLMNQAQHDAIKQFCERFPMVDVYRDDEMMLIQMKIDFDVIRNKGLGVEWVLLFNKLFKDVIVGIPERDSEHGMIITLIGTKAQIKGTQYTLVENDGQFAIFAEGKDIFRAEVGDSPSEALEKLKNRPKPIVIT